MSRIKVADKFEVNCLTEKRIRHSGGLPENQPTEQTALNIRLAGK